MTTTILSSKGQVIIPKAIRTAHAWHEGQKLQVLETGGGILLRPTSGFQPTELDQVAGCLHYTGPSKRLEDMNEAVAMGARKQRS